MEYFEIEDGTAYYGWIRFLWQPGRVDWVADGTIIFTVNNPGFTNNSSEYIMLNNWTGNPNWGGNPVPHKQLLWNK